MQILLQLQLVLMHKSLRHMNWALLTLLQMFKRPQMRQCSLNKEKLNVIKD